MLWRHLTKLTSCASAPLARTGPLGPIVLGHRAASGYAESITELIGKTPMIRLRKVPGPDCKAAKVLIKLEMENPGGSVKDRIALTMIEQAEARGDITPGKTTIVEATSGNTGIGLALVAAAKGYKLILIMPQVPSMYERYILCRKFGAQVHLTGVHGPPGEPDFGAVVKDMMDHMNSLLEANPDYWTPMQFETQDNPLAHFTTTGPEIWEQTGGEVDAFVAGAGTGGTLNGVSRYLKDPSRNPKCHVVCVEPTESRVLVGKPPGMHGIVGTGAGVELPLIEQLSPGAPFIEGARGTIDEFLHASTPECVEWANKVAAEEGLLIGPSSGAAVKVACDIAKRPEMDGKTIVVLQASSAIRYVSHPMWEGLKVEAKDALPVPPDLESADPVCRWRSDDYVPPPK